MEKPKRPLSSFNLFYRYKRSLLVDKGDLPIETIKSILTCPAGLEDEILPSSSTATTTTTSRSRDGNPDNNNTKRRTKIQTELNGKLLPSNTNKKRRHRKSLNGPSLSFVELGKLMTTSWKQLDEYGKQVFDDLAGEGREIYRVALEEYNNSGGGRVEESDGGASEDGNLEKEDGGKVVKQRNDGRRNSGKESGSDDDIDKKKVVPSRVASMPRTRSGTRRSSRSSSSSEGEKEPDVVASMPMKRSGKRRSSSSSSSSGGEKEQEAASMPLTRSSSSNQFKKNEDSSSSSSSSSDQSSPSSNKKRKEPSNMVSRCVKKALHERYYDHHFKTTGLDRRYEDAQDAPVPHHVSSAPACPSQEVGSSSAAAVPEVALSNNIEADFFERYADNSRVLDDADFNLYGNDIRTFFDASD